MALKALDLLERWEHFAGALHQGYDFGLDDYLNDVDVRQQLACVEVSNVPAASNFEARLATADAAMRGASIAIDQCVWGAANAAEHGWTSERNWWYFVIPARRGEEFDFELGTRQ